MIVTDGNADAAEKNARLLMQLRDDFRARDLGSISGFFRTRPDWMCPCCFRSKMDIARLDKNGNLLCALVDHHDHFGDCAHDQLRNIFPTWTECEARVASFRRFPHTLVCQDCNVAEPAAKYIVAAPEYFSFAPHEIAAFIESAPNSPHEVNPASVKDVYAALEESMRLLARRLRAMRSVSRD